MTWLDYRPWGTASTCSPTLSVGVRGIAHDAPGLNGDAPVAARGNGRVVRYQHQGRALLAVELAICSFLQLVSSTGA